MRIDRSKHSLFGASKVAADVVVQEYGRYFDEDVLPPRRLPDPAPPFGRRVPRFPRVPDAVHHERNAYAVFGYRGKQLATTSTAPITIRAFKCYFFMQSRAVERSTTSAAACFSNCSMIEAIGECERIAGRELRWQLSERNRLGDHRWWISDLSEFRTDYPEWRLRFGIEEILREIYDRNSERWAA